MAFFMIKFDLEIKIICEIGFLIQTQKRGVRGS